jgi:hypothetical protein
MHDRHAKVTHISETRVLLGPQCIEVFIFVRAHEPVEKLRFFLVRPMSRTARTAVLAHLGIIRVVVIDIGSSLLPGTLSILRFELLALGRGCGRLTIDGLHGHLVGSGIKRHVGVCMMRCPRMVGGYDVGTGVVTVVVRARIEANLGEVRV